MINWNPVPHMQHAWSQTQTVWGKIALVLFYSLIWVGILTSLWSIVFPNSQGVQCWMDAVQEENARLMMTALVRGVNVFAVGFLLYADVGGLKVKNVTMVTVFLVVYILVLTPLVAMGREFGCHNTLVQMWIWPSWAIFALILAVVDDKLADRGTAEETTSLTV